MHIKSVIAAATTLGLPAHHIAALETAYTTRCPPTPKPVGLFDTCKPGLEGMNRLRSVMRIISVLEYELYGKKGGSLDENQVKMIDLWIRIALPHIVTIREYVLNRKLYLKEIKAFTDRRFGAVFAARQAGKSVATAFFATAVMITCPEVHIGKQSRYPRQIHARHLRVPPRPSRHHPGKRH